MRALRKDLAAWKNPKLPEITRREVVLLLDDVHRRAPAAANRLQGYLVRMLNFACERGMMAVNPALGIRRRAAEPTRERVLNDEEIRLVWGLPGVPGQALRWMLCTGCRPLEAVGAHADEIEEKVWRIPPISDLALETVAGRKAYLPACARGTKRFPVVSRPGLC